MPSYKLILAQNPETPAERLEALSYDAKNLQPALAQNPNTPSPVLLRFFHLNQRALTKRLAQNPNLPASLLPLLPRYCAPDFIKNPALPLLLLETPNLLGTFSETFAMNLLSQDKAPLSLLEQGLRSKKTILRRGVAQNPSVPALWLQELAKDEHADVRGDVAQNPSTPAALLEELSYDRADSVRKEVLLHPNTSAAVLARHTKAKRRLWRRLAARHPQLTPALCKELATDPDPAVRLELTKHQPLTEELLRLLARDKDPGVRSVVAIHPNIPKDVLVELSADPGTCFVAISQASIEASILEQQAKSPDAMVWMAIAKNPNASPAVLEKLAARLGSPPHQRPEPWVSALAEHPNTPADVLERLSASLFPRVLRSLARNPSASAELLKTLTNAVDYQTRNIVKKKLQSTR